MEWRTVPAASNDRLPNFAAVRWLTYIRYFFFLIERWNLSISIFILRHEIRGEKKYGIRSTGHDELKKLKAKGVDVSHATFYMPTNYYMLEKVMSEVKKLPHNSVFLDIGCGAGRTLAIAAYYGFTKITGIDFSEQLCSKANANVILLKKKFPDCSFRVMQQEASSYEIPGDVSVIFLFNPFDQVIMEKVMHNIQASLQLFPRNIWIAYVNPQHRALFLANGFHEIFRHRKLDWLEGCILEKRVV